MPVAAARPHPVTAGETAVQGTLAMQAVGRVAALEEEVPVVVVAVVEATGNIHDVNRNAAQDEAQRHFLKTCKAKTDFLLTGKRRSPGRQRQSSTRKNRAMPGFFVSHPSRITRS